MKKSLVAVLLLVVGLLLPMKAEAVIVATFLDPAVGGNDPSLFVFTAGPTPGDPTGATIAQSPEGIAAIVDLARIGIVGTVDAYFTFPTLTYNGTANILGYQFDADNNTANLNTINFYAASDDSFLMSIDFSWATLNLSGVGGAESVLTANIINITIPGYVLTSPEAFAFTIGNPTSWAGAFAAGNRSAGEMNSAFNASANTAERDVPVPEPGSMLLLGTGLMGLAASARRRFGRKK